MALECEVNAQRGVAVLTGDVQYPNTDVVVQRTTTPTVEASWVVIRGGVRTGINPGGLVPFEDPEMPLGQPVFYRMLMTLPENAQRFVQRQLLSNPMFDSDTQTAPEDWKTVAPHVLTYVDGSADLDATAPLNGTSMARVSADPQRSLLYTVPLSHTGGAPGFVAGKKYRLTGYVQFINIGGQVWQDVYDENAQTWNQLGDTGIPWSNLLLDDPEQTEAASLHTSIKVNGAGIELLAPIKTIGIRPEGRGKWTFFAVEFTAPAITGFTPRVNLVTNPSAEVNATGWLTPLEGGFPAVATRSTAWHHVGTASLAITTSGTGTMATSDLLPVTAGKTYTASAYMRASTLARGIRIFMWFYTSADVQIGGAGRVYSSYVNDSTSDTIRVSVSGLAPATAAKVKLVIQVKDSAGDPPAPAGEVHYADAIMLEDAATIPSGNPYFDGSMPGYTWQGTAHASASAEVAPTAANAALTLSHGGTAGESVSTWSFDKLQIPDRGHQLRGPS
jgi:hypothetical protein